VVVVVVYLSLVVCLGFLVFLCSLCCLGFFFFVIVVVIFFPLPSLFDFVLPFLSFRFPFLSFDFDRGRFSRSFLSFSEQPAVILGGGG